jgi:hypothetical protein
VRDGTQTCWVDGRDIDIGEIYLLWDETTILMEHLGPPTVVLVVHLRLLPDKIVADHE